MLSFLFAVFLSQPRDSSKKGKQVVLHFDLSFSVATLTTKNVDVRVKEKARFKVYMAWGYSFLFGNMHVRRWKNRKFIKAKTKIGKCRG